MIDRQPELSIIIPALNEAISIVQVLHAIPGNNVLEVLVVDGGSSDGTPSLAEAAGAILIHEPQRGYGRACAAGLLAAKGRVVAFMDADGADDPALLPELALPVLETRADMVLGSRLAGKIEDGAMPWHQYAGNWLAAWFIRHLYHLPLTDLSPFRVVDRAALISLGMTELTYGWPTEMIVRGARAGWRIEEMPVICRPRIGGRSKISGTVRGTVLATLHILGTIFRYTLD